MKTRLPKGVYTLNLIQIFSTTGMGVLLGVLNAYLQHRGYSSLRANTVMSSVLALNFVLHFIAGIIGGRWIEYRLLFAFSVILQSLGLLGLVLAHWVSPLWALALFITGSGFNVSCLTIMLTQLFGATDANRHRAFSQNYACMNIGFLLTFLIANRLQLSAHYALIFAFAFASLLVTLVLHMSAYPRLAGVKATSPKPLRVLWLLIVLVLLLHFLFVHATLAHLLVYLGFLASLITVCALTYFMPQKNRRNCATYIVLISAAFFYALILGLSGTAIANFVLYNTHQRFLGMGLSTAGVNFFDPLAVVLFGFLLNRWLRHRADKGYSPWPHSRFISTALSLNIVAFLMLPLGILFASKTGYVSLAFPILFFIFAAGAEIGVNSVCYALAGQLVPPKYQGLFIGYMFMNVALGVSLGGPLANLVARGAQTPFATNTHYAIAFSGLALFAALATTFYAKGVPKLLNRKPKQEGVCQP